MVQTYISDYFDFKLERYYDDIRQLATLARWKMHGADKYNHALKKERGKDFIQKNSKTEQKYTKIDARYNWVVFYNQKSDV